MRYCFSPDFKIIEAYDQDNNYVAGLNYSAGIFLGKRRRPVTSRPPAFSMRNTQLYVNNIASAFMRLIFRKNTEGNLDWFAKRPNFYLFVKNSVENSYDQLAPLMENYGDVIYVQLQTALDRDVLDEDDVEILNYLVSYDGLIKKFADMRLEKEIFMPILERSEVAKSFANCYGYVQPVSNEYGPSFDWVASIYNAIINDGLAEKTPLKNIIAPVGPVNYSRNDAWLPLILKYYHNLYILKEHGDLPVEEGFLIDYARTEAMCEAIRQNNAQTLIDSAKLYHAPVEQLNNKNEIITYTQIDDVDKLNRLMPILNTLTLQGRGRLAVILEHHGFIVMPSKGCPFAIDVEDNRKLISIVRGVSDDYLRTVHANYLEYVGTLTES